MKTGLCKSLHDRMVMGAGLFLLGFLCVIWAPPAWLLERVLPRARARRLGRAAVTGFFRFYLNMLMRMGAARFDLSALDALRDAGPMIIAPNHPSLIDALLIISRLPQTGCVMKAELFENVLLRDGARLAGYISNASLRAMVRASLEDLAQGHALLLFPEGTRTGTAPIGELQRAVCVIARAACVPVQTVFIETESPYLTKGWTLFHRPPLPIVYRVRVGRRFEVGSDDAAFLLELRQYFSTELRTGARSSASVQPGAAAAPSQYPASPALAHGPARSSDSPAMTSRHD
jgi:1-acyl-sn-glycerol-3-phosphate acyltransferase